MAHKFNARFALKGVSLQDARTVLGTPAFHEAVSKKIPGSNLNVLHSGRSGPRYAMIREYDLDIDIHELAKKLLRGGFRMRREDEWDVETLSCRSRFVPNLPADVSCATRLIEQDGEIVVSHDWEVNVRIPLVHNIIARHAEGEIRRFNQLEIAVIQEELDARRAE